MSHVFILTKSLSYIVIWQWLSYYAIAKNRLSNMNSECEKHPHGKASSLDALYQISGRS